MAFVPAYVEDGLGDFGGFNVFGGITQLVTRPGRALSNIVRTLPRTLASAAVGAVVGAPTEAGGFLGANTLGLSLGGALTGAGLSAYQAAGVKSEYKPTIGKQIGQGILYGGVGGTLFNVGTGIASGVEAFGSPTPAVYDPVTGALITPEGSAGIGTALSTALDTTKSAFSTSLLGTGITSLWGMKYGPQAVAGAALLGAGGLTGGSKGAVQPQPGDTGFMQDTSIPAGGPQAGTTLPPPSNTPPGTDAVKSGVSPQVQAVQDAYNQAYAQRAAYVQQEVAQGQLTPAQAQQQMAQYAQDLQNYYGPQLAAAQAAAAAGTQATATDFGAQSAAPAGWSGGSPYSSMLPDTINPSAPPPLLASTGGSTSSPILWIGLAVAGVAAFYFVSQKPQGKKHVRR